MKQLAKVFNRQPFYRKKTATDWPLPEQLVGLEIEAENIRGNQSYPNERDITLYWRGINDGSLQRGREWVLNTPMSGGELGGAISAFFNSGQLVRDPAGSTHIHLNMMDEMDTVDGLRNLCVLIYLFEEVLFAVGDRGRAACGYTNRLLSAPERFIRTIFSPHLETSPQLLAHVFGEEGASRYYGFNMQALGRHGTVEFRYFPTATNAEELTSWVKLVMTFKKAAVELHSVPAVYSVLASETDYMDFVNRYFGQWYELFLTTIPYSRARENLTAIQAISAGIAAELDVSVNVSKLKEGRLRKFFVKVPAKAVAPEPIIRPDYIHVLPDVRGAKTPDNLEGFDRDAKHFLMWGGAAFVWSKDHGWMTADGYSIYSRMVNEHADTRFEDDYITYDLDLIAILNEKLLAAEGLDARNTMIIKRGIEEFEEWTRHMVEIKRSGKVKNKRSSMYRVQFKHLNDLWSAPEPASSFEELEPEEEDEENHVYQEDDEDEYEPEPEPYEDDEDDMPSTADEPPRPPGLRPYGQNSNGLNSVLQETFTTYTARTYSNPTPTEDSN